MEALPLHAVFYARGGKSSRTKRQVTWLLLRLVDRTKKPRWILGRIDAPGELIGVELKGNRARLPRTTRAKTVRIDCWTLSSPGLRKRRAAFRRWL